MADTDPKQPIIKTPTYRAGGRTIANDKAYEEQKALIDENIKNTASGVGAEDIDRNLWNPLDGNKPWIEYLQSGAVPYLGLNTDYTRKTGVNDASHRKTLAYSRMVDALNNKYYRAPMWAGVRSFNAATGSAIANEAPSGGQVYKMDGLETAESRAQKRAEGYEQTERGYDQALRARARGVPLSAEEAQEQLRRDYVTKLQDEKLRQAQQLQIEQFFQNYKTEFAERLQQNLLRFQTELGQLEIPLRKLAIGAAGTTGDPAALAAAQAAMSALGLGTWSEGDLMNLSNIIQNGGDYSTYEGQLKTLAGAKVLEDITDAHARQASNNAMENNG